MVPSWIVVVLTVCSMFVASSIVILISSHVKAKEAAAQLAAADKLMSLVVVRNQAAQEALNELQLWLTGGGFVGGLLGRLTTDKDFNKLAKQASLGDIRLARLIERVYLVDQQLITDKFKEVMTVISSAAEDEMQRQLQKVS